MQYRPEFLARELGRALELDEMRSEETAVRMRLAQGAGFAEARLFSHFPRLVCGTVPPPPPRRRERTRPHRTGDRARARGARPAAARRPGAAISRSARRSAE